MTVALIVCAAALVCGACFGWYCDSWLAGLFGAVVAAVVVGVAAWGISLGYSNPRDLTCFVTDKDRAKTDGASDMRVYTQECGVLHVQDLFWAREFSSADTFAAIEPGHRYRLHVTGIRMPFLSVFPNIRAMTELIAALGVYVLVIAAGAHVALWLYENGV